MHLVRIGRHTLNVDRLAEIWDREGEPGNDRPDVVVIFGDHRLDLWGAEAEEMRRFVAEHVRSPPPPPPSPPRAPRIVADLSGLDHPTG